MKRTKSISIPKTQHTPGHWTVRAGVDEYFIDAPGIVCLAVVNKCVNAPERAHEAKANAEFIVRACNEHAVLTEAVVKFQRQCDKDQARLHELLSALRDMLTAFDSPTYQDQFSIGSAEDKAIVKARAAIAKAEGK